MVTTRKLFQRWITSILIIIGFILVISKSSFVWAETTQLELTDEERQAKIAQVELGNIKTAYASWWLEQSESENLEAIQQAIASKATTIIIDNIGKNWITLPIVINQQNAHKQIFIEKDVTIEAKKGAFQGRNDYLFFLNQTNNVTIEGQGNVLFLMHGEDYKNYETYSEWRHGIFISRSTDISIKGITILNTGGDAVSINGIPPQENITLDEIHSESTFRNGLTVGGGRNITIKNSSFNKAGINGTAPKAGVDIEAHSNKDVFDNIYFENCEFSDNAVGGFVINTGKLDAQSEEIYIRVKGLTLKNNLGAGAAIQIPSALKAGGHVILDDVYMSRKDKTVFGIQVQGSHAFVDLNNVMLDLTQNPNPLSPALLYEKYVANEQGHLALTNVTIQSENIRDYLAFYYYDKSKLGPGNPPVAHGKVTINKEEESRIIFAEEMLAPHITAQGLVTDVAFTETTTAMLPSETFRFRGKVTGTGQLTQRIYWKVEGATSSQTVIDVRGVLTIAADEKAKGITVIGTPVSDPNKTIKQLVKLGEETLPSSTTPTTSTSISSSTSTSQTVTSDSSSTSQSSSTSTSLNSSSTTSTKPTKPSTSTTTSQTVTSNSSSTSQSSSTSTSLNSSSTTSTKPTKPSTSTTTSQTVTSDSNSINQSSSSSSNLNSSTKPTESVNSTAITTTSQTASSSSSMSTSLSQTTDSTTHTDSSETSTSISSSDSLNSQSSSNQLDDSSSTTASNSTDTEKKAKASAKEIADTTQTKKPDSKPTSQLPKTNERQNNYFIFSGFLLIGLVCMFSKYYQQT